MDFDAVFKLILNGFQESNVDFALIGGFALASLGHPRATVDIDFLLDKVITAEDLIGLKVQSSTNDPSRYHQDMADIEILIKENHKKLDFNLVKEYFAVFNRTGELNQILEKIKNVK